MARDPWLVLCVPLRLCGEKSLPLCLLASFALLTSFVSSASAQQLWRAPIVEWGPEGKVLVGAGGLLARFDLDSDEEELLVEPAGAFALSPPDASGGSRLAVAVGERLELCRYPGLAVEGVLQAPQEISALAWAADGATLAAGTRAGHILLWEVARRPPESRAPQAGELWANLNVEPPSPVVRLRFSADGVRLLSAFEDGRGVLWDLERREVLHRFEPARFGRVRPEASGPGEPESAAPETEVSVVALSPDGRHLLATRVQAGQAEILLLDDRGALKWQRSGYGIEFTPDGAALLALAPPFRIAALYRVSDAEALRIFEPPERVRTLYLVRVSPDGTKLLGVGEEAAGGQVLILWDFATARVLKTRR